MRNSDQYEIESAECRLRKTKERTLTAALEAFQGGVVGIIRPIHTLPASRRKSFRCSEFDKKFLKAVGITWDAKFTSQKYRRNIDHQDSRMAEQS